MSQIFTCQFDSHNSLGIIAYCLNMRCSLPPQCCLQCIQKKHVKHIEDCLQFQDIIKFLKKSIEQKKETGNCLVTQLKRVQQSIDKIIKDTNRDQEQFQQIIQLLEEQKHFDFKNSIHILKKYYCVGKSVDYQEIENKAKLIRQFSKICQEQIKILGLLDQNLSQLYYGQGITLMKTEKWEEAIIQFDLVIAMDKQNCDAIYQKGKALRLLKKYIEADQCIANGLKIDSNHSNLYVEEGNLLNKIANLLFIKNDYNQALLSYEKSIQIDPGNYLAYNGIGDCLKQQQKYQEAIKNYDKAIHFHQNDIDSLIGKGSIYFYYIQFLGQCLFEQQQFDEAIKCYDKAIQYCPNYKKSYITKGQILTQQQKYEDAIQCLDKAIQLDSNDKFAHIGKGIVFVLLFRQQAIVYSIFKNTKKPLSLLTKPLNQTQMTKMDIIAKVQFLRYSFQGNCLHNLEKYDEALKCYNQAIELDPLCVCLNNQQKYDEAINNFQKAVEMDRRSYSGQLGLGNALHNQQKYNEAMVCYNKAIKLNPNSPSAYQNKGNSLHNQTNYNEAIQCYDMAIRLNPNQANVYLNKAISLDDQGKYDEAIQCYDQSIKLAPNDISVHYNKGRSLQNQQKFREAIECFKRVIQLKSNYGKAYREIGFCLDELNQYEEAIQSYDKAIQINPKDAIIFNNKGVTLKQLHKYSEALTCYNQAIEIDPNLAAAYTNKGIILEQLEQYQMAQQCYKLALKKGGEPKQLDSWIQELNQKLSKIN